MAYKKLPNTGDSNWGIPLVKYISGTRDNTKGGAYNQFSKFYDRPLASALTADDAGLTYLYTRTGNTHQWNGGAWEVITRSNDAVNVLDFGDAGSTTGIDLNKDDTSIFAAAITDISGYGGGQRLFIPAGHYRIKLATYVNQLEIFGEGKKTIIYCTEANEYAISVEQVGANNTMRDLTFKGNWGPGGPDVLISHGITHSKRNGPNSGTFYENIIFDHCKIGFYKASSLYMRFYNCTFDSCMLGSTSNQLYNPASNFYGYSGFDYYDNCKFYRNKNAAVVYYNRPATEENNTIFNKCEFKDNFGITLYANYSGIYGNSLTFNECWFENNARNYGQPIDLYDDNTPAYTTPAKEFDLDKCKGTLNNCVFLPFNGLKLTTQSNLQFKNTNLPSSDKIEISEDSKIECDDISGTQVLTDIQGGTFLNQKDLNTGNTSIRSGNTRPAVTRAFKNEVKFGSFSTLPDVVQVVGGAVGTIISGEGLYNNKCLKIAFAGATDKWSFNWNNSATHKKYAVHSYSIKSLDTTTVKVEVGFEATAKRTILLKNNLWQTYNGICETTALDSNFSFLNQSGVAANILVSKLQIVEFDTLLEANVYLKSDYYALPTIDTITSYGDAIPTVGTYVKGDILYNSNPSTGSYIGWTCITAGTPGTWKQFGLIKAALSVYPPKISINPAGTVITLTYADTLKTSAVPAVSAFTLSGSNTVSSIIISGNTATLNLTAAYATGIIVSVNYTSPNASTGIQDTLSNLATNFTGLKLAIGLIPVEFPTRGDGILQTENTYTYTLTLNYGGYMASNQKMAGDGTFEMELVADSGRESPIFGLDSRPSILGILPCQSQIEIYLGTYFTIFPGENSAVNSNINALAGDRQRIKRVGSVLTFQYQRAGTNTWIDIRSSLANVPTGIMYMHAGFQGTANNISHLSNPFGTGITAA
jgi:Putative flagellar system-associated repeat